MEEIRKKGNLGHTWTQINTDGRDKKKGNLGHRWTQINTDGRDKKKGES
jgi:hypothetical protein